MKLFQNLASFLRGAEPVKDKIDMSFERLSDLPVALFALEKEPFNQWHDPGTKIAEEHRAFVKDCVILYQFFTFYLLISKRYGEDAAEATINLQMLRLSNVSPELGKELKDFIQFIRKGVEDYARKPHIVEDLLDAEEVSKLTPDQRNREVGIEYWLAIGFLTKTTSSPFHMTREEFETKRVPNFGDLDFNLAACLAYGKARALEVFEHMIAVANVTR